MSENERPIVAIDFDGVLNKYHGWRGENILEEPQAGVAYFLRKINKNYDVVIFTCRDIKKVREWLNEYKLSQYIRAVTMTKPHAYVYIDDRAITYNGSYSEVLEKLEEFCVWWDKG